MLGERPEVLGHPNIPKPLHGMNPRSILGKSWWDMTRFAAQKKYGYRCAACGIPKAAAPGHRWLEGHEYWNIDYQTGRCEVVEIVPLCHWCHNFIHSGRLAAIAGREKTYQEVQAILEYGFSVLIESENKAFIAAKEAAEHVHLQVPDGIEFWEPPVSDVGWNDWVLILNGQEYRGRFRSYEEWERHYA